VRCHPVSLLAPTLSRLVEGMRRRRPGRVERTVPESAFPESGLVAADEVERICEAWPEGRPGTGAGAAEVSGTLSPFAPAR
jgi:hypothetical protein